MAQKISGEYYKIVWDEGECKWTGFVTGMQLDGKIRDDIDVQVCTDYELSQVLLTVVHHLDDLVEDARNGETEVHQG